MRNAMDAIDAAPSAEDRMLSIDAALNDEGEIDVRVRDRGPGICNDDAERVFDPFYSTKASGLGIGLAICRNIVEAHGGRLWLASAGAPGGAVFAFTLPAADSGEA
jgi:signal transduction histidine kinase